MNLSSPVEGESEPSEEYAHTIEPLLTREMIRNNWQLFRRATCRHCGGVPKWNPRFPTELSCTTCGASGETPEQNSLLFKERLVITH